MKRHKILLTTCYTSTLAFGMFIFLLCPLLANAQELPDKNCIATSYSLKLVQVNNDGNIEVANFHDDVKYFSSKTGVLLGRAKLSVNPRPKQPSTVSAYQIIDVQNKKDAIYTAKAQEVRNGKDTIKSEKRLQVKGDSYDVYFWQNPNAGISFIKTKSNLFFLSPYRIDTLVSGKSATAEFFKNAEEKKFHPGNINSGYQLDERGLGVLLTHQGTLISAKNGIIGHGYPKPVISTPYNENYLFWENKPYLTYASPLTHTEINMVTLDYETGEILRIVSIPETVTKTFMRHQNSYPTFKPINDNEFLIYAKQHSPNSYVWLFDRGEIRPLCDLASRDEYADAKQKSDAFYAWERKNRQAQQEAKQQADAKWARDNTVTRSQCAACGGKGGTLVENVTSASGVGYRTVYETDGFGNKKYVTSNYGKTFYRCKQCNGTGMVSSKNK